MVAQILIARNTVETIRGCVELAMMYALGMVGQVIEPGITLIVVSRVIPVLPQFHPVTRLSRMPLLVPPEFNTQIDLMHFSPDRIRKILLIWLLVRYRSFIYMFMLY